VTRTISDWGLEDGYFANESSAENFYQDLTWLCVKTQKLPADGQLTMMVSILRSV
jgi:hypothetical protein